MNGMLSQQQGQVPQPQQQGQAPQQQGKQPYPANAEEVSQFMNDIMRALYSEGQPEKIIRNLTTSDNLPAKLGQTAGMVVISILERRRTQNGRKPHFKLIILGLKKALEEMSDMMEMAGMERPAPEILQEASNYAGQVVETAISPGKSQQAPQQAPQQEVM